MKKTLAFALLLILSISARPLWAWGPEGHEIVALIAQHYLDPATIEQLKAIKNASFNHQDLMTGDTYEKPTVDDQLNAFFAAPDVELVDIPNWADGWDHKAGDAAADATAPWHFVDLPIDAPADDAAVSAQCPNGACVIDQLEAHLATLKDPSASAEDKMEALLFVVHFAGDIHQPLHCANDNDRGGNDKSVVFFGSAKISGKNRELHALWDTYFLQKHNSSDTDYANELIAGISEAQKEAWENTDVQSWAVESHAVAVSIYADYQSKVTGGESVPDYEQADEDNWIPVIDTQLEKAGVRLAYVLKTTLTGSPALTPGVTPSSTDTPVATAGQLKIVHPTAIVYTEPTSKSKHLAKVKEGDLLDLLDPNLEGNYYKVQVDGKTGYTYKTNGEKQ